MVFPARSATRSAPNQAMRRDSSRLADAHVSGRSGCLASPSSVGKWIHDAAVLYEHTDGGYRADIPIRTARGHYRRAISVSASRAVSGRR
jgi:hypothetical protein